ncbi:MAG: hypothetical protein HZC51_01650 [Nitrospirae bacterium]|nr:hypothetical protein [Nitrospirota bacterium]
MADNDFRELKEFFKEQFEAINKRLDNTATKDDLKVEITTAKEDVMRYTGILLEEVQYKLDLLAEGRLATHERIERDKDDNVLEHSRLEKMGLVNAADISALDQRVGRLEGRH